LYPLQKSHGHCSSLLAIEVIPLDSLSVSLLSS
jgi:hypothetical protein